MARFLPWLLIVAAACAGREPAPKALPAAAAPRPSSPMIEQIRAALETYRQAYEVRSIETLSALYQQGLDVVVVHQGHSYRGWTAVRAYLSDLFAGASEVQAKLGDIAIVELSPDAAAVTATLTRSIGDGVAAVQETGILSLAFVRHAGFWLVVSEHFSYPVH